MKIYHTKVSSFTFNVLRHQRKQAAIYCYISGLIGSLAQQKMSDHCSKLYDQAISQQSNQRRLPNLARLILVLEYFMSSLLPGIEYNCFLYFVLASFDLNWIVIVSRNCLISQHCKTLDKAQNSVQLHMIIHDHDISM